MLPPRTRTDEHAGTLMDSPDLDGALAEALRLLRPGGMLAFSITHPCSMTRGAEHALFLHVRAAKPALTPHHV
jgi:hypothetical protein